MLLRQYRNREWTVTEAGKRLYIDDAEAAHVLGVLTGRGFFVQSPTGCLALTRGGVRVLLRLLDRYADLNDRVERLTERINDRFSRPGYRPIVLRRTHHEAPTVFRYYRAARLCYGSSLHDRMNLVAKEFVAARADELGVLVLSRFAGAASELSEG